MPSYRQTAYNDFETPSGAVGEAPDGPGAFQHVMDQVDARIGIGGAEYAANTAAMGAIPASRCFLGKHVRNAADGVTYAWNGTTWVAWSSAPAVTGTTVNNLTLGNGTVAHSAWWTNGVLKGKFALTWGSTTTATGALLPVTSGTGYLTTGSADTTYPHVGNGYVFDSSANTYTGLFARLDNGFRLSLWSQSGVALTGTSIYPLAVGDIISVSYEIKFF